MTILFYMESKGKSRKCCVFESVKVSFCNSWFHECRIKISLADYLFIYNIFLYYLREHFFDSSSPPLALPDSYMVI